MTGRHSLSARWTYGGGHSSYRCTDGYSTSRTCEISLSNHSGVSFRSLLYLVHDALLTSTDSLLTDTDSLRPSATYSEDGGHF